MGETLLNSYNSATSGILYKSDEVTMKVIFLDFDGVMDAAYYG